MSDIVTKFDAHRILIFSTVEKYTHLNVLGVVFGLQGLAHILTIKKDASDFGLLLRKEWFGLFFFPEIDGVVSIVTTILIVSVLIMAFR